MAFGAAFAFVGARFFLGSFAALTGAFFGLFLGITAVRAASEATTSTLSVLTSTSTTGFGFFLGSLLALATGVEDLTVSRSPSFVFFLVVEDFLVRAFLGFSFLSIDESESF